MIYSSLHTYLL